MLLECAGTTQVKLQSPALWHIMGGGFGSGNLHGAVAHGDGKTKTYDCIWTLSKASCFTRWCFSRYQQEGF